MGVMCCMYLIIIVSLGGYRMNDRVKFIVDLAITLLELGLFNKKNKKHYIFNYSEVKRYYSTGGYLKSITLKEDSEDLVIRYCSEVNIPALDVQDHVEREVIISKEMSNIYSVLRGTFDKALPFKHILISNLKKFINGDIKINYLKDRLIIEYGDKHVHDDVAKFKTYDIIYVVIHGFKIEVVYTDIPSVNSDITRTAMYSFNITKNIDLDNFIKPLVNKLK